MSIVLFMLADPDPTNCGYVKVDHVPISTVTMTEDQVQAFMEFSGVDPLSNEAMFGGVDPNLTNPPSQTTPESQIINVVKSGHEIIGDWTSVYWYLERADGTPFTGLRGKVTVDGEVPTQTLADGTTPRLWAYNDSEGKMKFLLDKYLIGNHIVELDGFEVPDLILNETSGTSISLLVGNEVHVISKFAGAKEGYAHARAEWTLILDNGEKPDGGKGYIKINGKDPPVRLGLIHNGILSFDIIATSGQTKTYEIVDIVERFTKNGENVLRYAYSGDGDKLTYTRP